MCVFCKKYSYIAPIRLYIHKKIQDKSVNSCTLISFRIENDHSNIDDTLVYRQKSILLTKVISLLFFFFYFFRSETFVKGGFFWFFLLMYVIQHCFICRRFHCVGGCWDRTQDFCDFGIDRNALTTWLDLIHLGLISSILVRSHPPWLDHIHFLRLTVRAPSSQFLF